MELRTDTAIITRFENYVEMRYFLSEGRVEVSDIVENWNAANSLAGKDKHMFLVVGKATLLSPDAREVLIKEMKEWTTIAIKVNNLAQRIMAGVVMSFIGIPKVQVFRNERDGLNWLLSKISGPASAELA